MDAVTAYLTALALSVAAGLNAWIPLLAVGLLARADQLTLPSSWSFLEDPVVLGVLAIVAVADFVGDKVPAVDHVLHTIGVVIAPASAVVAVLAATGSVEVSTAAIVAVSIVTAELTHGARATIRPASTLATGGAGNPVLSLAEDGVSVALAITAVLVPVVAFVLVLAVALTAIWLVRRAWRRRGSRPVGRTVPPVPPPPPAPER